MDKQPKPKVTRNKPPSWFNFFGKKKPAESSLNNVNKGKNATPQRSATGKVFQNYHRDESDQKINLKVFKPKKDYLIQEKIKSKIEQKTKIKLPLWLKFPSFKFDPQSLKFDSLLKTLNYYVVKWAVLEKFNQFVAKGLLVIAILLTIYISFFDTYFLVKSYTITFSEGSFLSEKEIRLITQSIDQNKFLGVIPNNQYWFLSQRNLTDIAQSQIPEVESVKVKNRTWPNKVELEIKTEPILATLSVQSSSSRKYWRVTQLGRVITEDTIKLQEKLITIDRRVSFNQNNATLQDYALDKNQQQLNRMWFVTWLWKQFENSGIQISSTNFPSLTDTDVVLNTAENTKLLFDSNIGNIPREVMELRVNAFLSTTLVDSLKRGEIAYVDFRIPNKKLYLCGRAAPCDK
ncbi:MAG: hypothetical protein WCK98_07165 [bacterium]